jgi:hypothetical protein
MVCSFLLLEHTHTHARTHSKQFYDPLIVCEEGAS